MIEMGHNEKTVRLAALAGDAQVALDKVSRGEADAIEGWLAYGAAMNEGRALFPGDREFSAWMAEWQVAIQVEAHERSAAMWAAANSDQFEEARAAGRARTVRGIHSKWKEMEAERERAAKEAERKEAARVARQVAQEQAMAEEQARAAASVAATPEERQEVEAKADQAATARVEAEAVAKEAEEQVQQIEDPHTKARKGLSGLSREGLEDEVIGLREENAELRADLAARDREIADMKARMADLTDGDAGRAIGRLQRNLAQSEGRAKEYQAAAARLQRQVNAQAAEIKKLRGAIESQEIPL